MTAKTDRRAGASGTDLLLAQPARPIVGVRIGKIKLPGNLFRRREKRKFRAFAPGDPAGGQQQARQTLSRRRQTLSRRLSGSMLAEKNRSLPCG